MHAMVAAQNKAIDLSPMAFVNFVFRILWTANNFYHKHRDGYEDVEKLLETELELKFWCIQTLIDMFINQCRLYDEHKKRRSPPSVIDPNNERIYHVMKNLQDLYFRIR